jgi:hypothetical protein
MPSDCGMRVQTIGMNIGYFLSFTGFLALNDPDFCNRFLRQPEAASEEGVLSLSSYLRLWAVIYAAVTVALWLFKRERPWNSSSAALCVFPHPPYPQQPPPAQTLLFLHQTLLLNPLRKA